MVGAARRRARPPASARSSRATRASAPGVRLDVDLRDAPVQAGQPLGDRQRGDGDGARGERAERGARRGSPPTRIVCAPAAREHRARVARLARRSRRRRSAGSSSPPANAKPPGPNSRVPRPPSRVDRRRDAEQLHATRGRAGPTIATFSRSTGAATLHAGQAPRCAARGAASKPSGERAASCRRAEPTTWWTSSPAEPVRLVLATSTPSTSATPTAMPLPASSSCTACERSRTR